MPDLASLDLPTEIHTPRLLLRIPSMQDVEPFQNLMALSHEHLQRWMAWACTLPEIQVTRERMEQSIQFFHDRKEHLRFMIVRRSDAALMGTSIFNFLDWDTPKAEIGYWLGKDFTGQGYMREAVQAMLEYGFNEMKLHRIEICTDEENLASRRIPEKLGFTLEAVLREERRHHLHPEKYINFCIYGLLEREYRGQIPNWSHTPDLML
ncbi:GNAT family N-acetyltransferase [Deinococcus cellulosilyticus]|uniref:Ribosomal protein N-acetyltransferase n=1 Tax=Deinococcus cellulosilyticus (strain DSM 18568 / NBRC 106333 / KACC 11606 / 5516J-15) TaxID=1223518 RepID=A0A511N4M6_DEIC1|nr:GNAT family N-acetyltransferase [Deinococcus cellulosilyticus]GEM47792.1 ribosomal protein N-acetyltransferase [Deinococcus cellulosilyticus NBRC 106333 = KACC 11606]